MKREGESPFKKGLWTVEEDKLLMDHVKVHGKGQWNKIARKTDLKRSGKSCRLRWMNYLSPNVKKGDFSEEEEDLIIRLHKLLGNRWSLIAKRIPGRTDNQVKNYWNSHLSKKLGIKGQSKKRVDSCQSSKEVKVCECNHQAQAAIDPSSSRTSTGTTEIAVDQGYSQNQTAIETGHEVLSTTNTQESAISPSSNQTSSGTLEMAVSQGCNPNQKAIETCHEVLSTTNTQESVVIHDQSYMNPLWIPGDGLELSTLNMMDYFDECSSMYLA